MTDTNTSETQDDAYETVDIDEEYERLVEAITDASEHLADLDPATDQAATLDARAERLDVHRRGVAHARDEWGVDEIVLRPLTIGDDVRLDEHTAGVDERRLWKIAIGTVAAPYLEHDGRQYPAVEMDAVRATVATVDRTVPIAVGRWLESRIDEVSTVGNPSGEDSYARLRAATATTSTPE